MRKKAILLVLILSLLFATGCSGSIDESSVDESSDQTQTVAGSVGLEYLISENGISYSVVGKGTCQDSTISIPSSYMGKTVTKIAEEAFAYTEGISEIFIPAAVKYIQAKAFFMCVDLERAVFEETLGWQALSIPTMPSGDQLALEDAEQAATLLMTTYSNFYWMQTNP